jgi:hypothetical protein
MNLLDTILKEEKSKYNKRFGQPGSKFEPGTTFEKKKEVKDDFLTILETCSSFVQQHEGDAFKQGKDIIYVGDEAFPDGYFHKQHEFFTKEFDVKGNELILIRAKKLFQKINGGK